MSCGTCDNHHHGFENMMVDYYELRSKLELNYDELRKRNEANIKASLDPNRDIEKIKSQIIEQLKAEQGLTSVTVCFTDIEGRFHMLDYDKEFLLDSYDNLTFDGSSVRGFTGVEQSDLRLGVDWESLKWLPADVFGSGKAIVFGLIQDRDGTPYESDFRYRLKKYLQELHKQNGYRVNVAVECEGFLFSGRNAEQSYKSINGFKLVSEGGYYHSLPCDDLRLFIDRLADAQRVLGFKNEKDHPEVAPSQFELNYSYTDALHAADLIQIYKLTAKQIAANQGMTASFLPKPIAGINGSGMHTNISISKDGENLFFDASGEENLSKFAWEFVDRILSNANDICLILNSSVNAYRRLDPNYEAPNQIKASAVDRTSMVRIPLGNKKSQRVEVRTVAPDANPYLSIFSLITTGLSGPLKESFSSSRSDGNRILPGDIYCAMKHFSDSPWVKETLGETSTAKYLQRKEAAANRCPKELGTIVKTEEVIFHHEVTNQYLWGRF